MDIPKSKGGEAMSSSKSFARYSPLWITTTALFMAMNVALSSVSIPVPGGHFYLCDVIICTAAILLDPLSAFLVGGVGSFLGDLFFYPAPMFVSLATHGLQAVVISLCVRQLRLRRESAAAVIGVSLGAAVMVIGYTLGRAYVYATPEYAVVKLPYEILQAAVGAVAGVLLCYHARLKAIFEKWFPKK